MRLSSCLSAACFTAAAFSIPAYAGAEGLEVGAFYSVAEPTHDHYRVVKILVLEPDVVHVAVFSNKFQRRPRRVVIKKLYFGAINDPNGPGFPHMPLRAREFRKWQPVFLQAGRVSTEELSEYRNWKAAGGKVLVGDP